MKNLKLIIILFALVSMQAKADDEKTVKSKISDVTVFLQGAQITRTAGVNIPAGTTKIIFEGVSPYLQTNSIQASGKGNFIIMETQFFTKHIPPGNKKENAVPASIERRILEISDSLTELTFDIENLTLKQNAWAMEKNMLEKNKLMQGQSKTDSLQLFMMAMDFYRLKIHDINKSIMDVKKELFYVNKLKADLQRRLNELNNYKNRLLSENVIPAKYLYQIIVSVSAKSSCWGTVDVNYFVNNASWTPSYDLRADDTKSPVNLTYKANILQNTGEEWDNVKLTLSTKNPNRSNIKPNLLPWKLRYYVQRIVNRNDNIQTLCASNISMPVTEEMSDKDMEYKKVFTGSPSQISSAYTQQVTNMTNVEFKIDLKYSIPTDGKSHQVVVMENDIASEFKHFAVPKLNTDAFLISRMSGWEELNLLPGPANIYFLNTFIGATYIDPNTIEDTLNISMGQDPGIAISRKKLKDSESTQVVGNDKVKSITIEVTIRNKKNEAVSMTVEDQVPISGEDGIKVFFDSDEVKDADYSKNTGKLSWEVKLAPKETKKIKFSYTIKYPKDKTLM
ncbi:MAG: DUF4139 domain-containing protein [Saprospiraceae bacterium]|nr:DUF4139 domain-containing protein [Saprospiraceae bacterium]